MASIARRISDATRILRAIGYKPAFISVQEFYDYMTGDTLTGDTITIDQVLASDYFVMHEIAEMTELKRRGIMLTKKSILQHPRETYAAHLVAAEQELSYAQRNRDCRWMKYRLGHAKYWLDDPHLPTKLRPLYKSFIKKLAIAADSPDAESSEP